MLIHGLLIPDDLHYLVEQQTWARPLPGGVFRLGITALGLKASGEIYMCRPKSVGTELAQGRAMAVVELAKSIVSVKTPLSGTVLQVNKALEEQPELIWQDPYGEGWLLDLQASDWVGEQAALLSGEAARQPMEQYAWLNQIKPQT
ncbi:glycine cleavage system H protein [Paucibacter oligotrophus]|uniref:Glycine cleavage system H protein n=1 Tax=Roseateles oligotrophus TaxID=1769250 RepID=A0A840L1A5_9BURK|nr:glycine cleavage system protein H [Roseateles oligotrophus]MBB4842030.1 glycine cleavage system H protein [Roseateles oligotrophus]